ncbi:hypothetical protein Tco_0231992 [Tanacetum coccineum]
MFGQCDTTYGSQHAVGDSSSQLIVCGSSSPVRHFSLDDMETMYSSQFSESYREEESSVEEEEIQVSAPKKNTNRIRQPALDQAKRKGKAGKSSTSSVTGFDVNTFKKLIVNEYAMVNDPHNVQKGHLMIELLHIKNMELELKAKELKIQQIDQRQ